MDVPDGASTQELMGLMAELSVVGVLTYDPENDSGWQWADVGRCVQKLLAILCQGELE